MTDKKALRRILREALEKGRSLKKISEALDIPLQELEFLCAEVDHESRILREPKDERIDARYLNWKRAKEGAKAALAEAQQ